MRLTPISSRFVFLAVVVLGAPAEAQQAAARPAAPATAEQVIARYVKAIGGQAALAAVKYRHTVERMDVQNGPGGSPAPLIETETWWMAPNRIFVRTNTVGVGAQELGYDGKHAWMISPVAGPSLMPEEFAKSMVRSLSAIPDYTSVRELRMLGLRELAGQPVYAISFVAPRTGEVIEYFDPQTGLKSGARGEGPAVGGAPSTVHFLEYQRQGGVMRPMLVRVLRDTTLVATIRTVKHSDAPIDTALFTMPPAVQALVPRAP